MPKQYMYGAVKTPAVAAIGPIPIATPKRLKIAVTDSKQNTEAISNRYKNGPSGARENCKFCASAAKTGLIRNDLSARLKSCPDENRRCHPHSEARRYNCPPLDPAGVDIWDSDSLAWASDVPIEICSPCRLVAPPRALEVSNRLRQNSRIDHQSLLF